MSTALREQEIELEIPFHDCDMMGVVWHGNYFRYFEVARCALLRSFNYDYLQMRDSGYAWPIVDAQIKYVGSARYEQRIKVLAKLVEWENRLRIDYLIRAADTGARLTRGYTIQVAVAMASGEMQLVSPPILRERLGLSA
ncbi:acyl-CoA thioesterase [Permianibacter fluminis]|uniref:acyl-CoA thioesterase n=1 Tax=Permianibacter fluminis TaxID=2738515 RepID=UPI002E291D03|nr:acyl-CoA thioesterase [Permianibacter fluminis]